MAGVPTEAQRARSGDRLDQSRKSYVVSNKNHVGNPDRNRKEMAYFKHNRHFQGDLRRVSQPSKIAITMPVKRNVTNLVRSSARIATRPSAAATR